MVVHKHWGSSEGGVEEVGWAHVKVKGIVHRGCVVSVDVGAIGKLVDVILGSRKRVFIAFGLAW
jgi:hypothetical protein